MVMGMILLVLLTLLGLTAMGTSVLEERMAANARDRIRAFQAAEAALRYCEGLVDPQALFNNTNGFYQPAAPGNSPPWEVAATWTGNNSRVRPCTGADCIALVDSQPRCIAEELGDVLYRGTWRGGESESADETFRFYRVTARGVGTSDKTVVLVQSTLKLPLGN